MLHHTYVGSNQCRHQNAFRINVLLLPPQISVHMQEHIAKDMQKRDLPIHRFSIETAVLDASDLLTVMEAR